MAQTRPNKSQPIQQTCALCREPLIKNEKKYCHKCRTNLNKQYEMKDHGK